MNYSDLGYDKNLNKTTDTDPFASEQTDLQFDQSVSNFSGSKVDENTLPGSSIVNDSLTNAKIAPSNRIATAILSKDADADFGDFKEAVDYVAAQGGGKIVVLPGTYTFQIPCEIATDITIEAISVDDCILDFENKPNNLTLTSSINVNIQGLTIKNCSNSLQGAIALNGASQCSIERCKFKSNMIDISQVSVKLILIDRCRTEFSGQFVKGNGTSSSLNWISRSEVISPTGIAFQDIPQTIISGTYFESLTTYAFRGSFRYSVISDSNVTTSSVPVIMSLDANNTHVHVTNNYFNSAIELIGSGDNYFANNFLSIYRSNTPAMLIDGGDRNLINGNNMGSSLLVAGSDGIKLINGANNNVITGNSIRPEAGVPAYGVNIATADCSGNVVVGNHLTGTSGDTQNLGSSNVIANNA